MLVGGVPPEDGEQELEQGEPLQVVVAEVAGFVAQRPVEFAA